MINDPIFLIITVVTMLLSRFTSYRLQSKFRQFSQVAIPYTGAEIAQMMLNDHGVGRVKITSVRGALTDHYNPANHTVNLSDVVCRERNVAAAAVAAHECGHAVQHAKSFSFLKMRSALVPVVNISATITPWVLMAGLFMAMPNGGSTTVLLIGVILFSATTLFSLVTLPVEFDASRRALVWLKEAGILPSNYHSMAKDALWWAAMTYVVAALASLGQLLYYVMILMRARSRNR